MFTSDDGRVRIPGESGWFCVPEVRDRRDSRVIEIAYVRLFSNNPDPGPPIVLLEGGPGTPGIETAAWLPERYTTYLELGDVIALDQRGIGLSRPCLTSPYRLDLPLGEEVTQERYVEAATDTAGRTAAYWRTQGVDLRGYTTQESADDVAGLMTALGAPVFRTSGGSYGSHLSLSVIRRHGHRVERAYIAMVEGPDDTYKLPSSSERHLDALAALAAEAEELDGLVPDLKGLMRRVFEAVRDKPVTVDGVVIGEFDVKAITAGNMGSLPFLKALPARYLEMEGGDFSWIVDHVRGYRQDEGQHLMSLLMDCASGASPERLHQIEAEAPHALLGSLINEPFPTVCDALAGPCLGPEFRAPVTSDVPVLFASGSLDGRTPPENALAVLEGFPHGSHLLVRGAAHASVHHLPEVRPHVGEFMAGRPLTTSEVELEFRFDRPR